MNLTAGRVIFGRILAVLRRVIIVSFLSSAGLVTEQVPCHASCTRTDVRRSLRFGALAESFRIYDSKCYSVSGGKARAGSVHFRTTGRMTCGLGVSF